MTQTPYGGQGYASTGLPYGAPSLDQPLPDHSAPASPWAPGPPAAPTGGLEPPAASTDGFSPPVITEVQPSSQGADTTTIPSAGGPAAPGLQGPAGPAASAGVPAAAAGPAARARARSRGPRRARLQLRHINPWTVLKFSCVLSIALFFVWLITIGLLFGILDAAGVVSKINDTVTTINGAGSKDPVTPGIVFGGAAIIGVINIILFIALSTIGAVVYNLCADLVGGVEVTLSEREV